MDLEQAVILVNKTLLASYAGRQLSEIEVALFKGAWESETYEKIAFKSGYSLNYLQRDIGPKFWKLLSNIFNRRLNKTNLRGVIGQSLPIASIDIFELHVMTYIVEYALFSLIISLSQEIIQACCEDLKQYLLVKAQTKDDIRVNHSGLFLCP